jgi:hypothetical protein
MKMKKVIIVIIIILSTFSSAEAKIWANIGKFFSRSFYYGLKHQPTLPPADYNYEFEVPADSIGTGVGTGVGTAYDTSLSDHESLSGLLTAMAAIGAVLGLWFLYLIVAPKRRSPKRAAVESDSHCVPAKHNDTSPRNRQPKFVYLAGHGGVMLI